MRYGNVEVPISMEKEEKYVAAAWVQQAEVQATYFNAVFAG